MTDRHGRDAMLRARLRAADAIAAPDLWPVIERRVPTSLDPHRGRRSPIRRILVAAAALALAAGGLFVITRAFVGSRPVMATDLPGSGGVAYLATSDDGHSLSLKVIVGTHPGLRSVTLATGLGTDAGPAWSPDGARIAYVAPLPAGRSGVVVQNADGTGKAVLTDCCRDSDPAWSPDGTSIAFVRSPAGPSSSAIFVVPSSGGPARQVCPARFCGGWIAELAWSPDSLRIAFSHAARIGRVDPSDLTTGIDVIGANGSGLRHLTACVHSHCSIDVAPSWSPDGRRILYNRGAGLGHGQRFRVIDVATGSTQTVAGCIVPHCPQATVPVWSPDGGSIAYATSHAPSTTDPAVLVVNVRTTTAVTLPTCPSGDCPVPFAITWSPDGGALVFVAGERSNGRFVGQGLYLLPVTGGPAELLSADPGSCCPVWQPEGGS